MNSNESFSPKVSTIFLKYPSTFSRCFSIVVLPFFVIDIIIFRLSSSDLLRFIKPFFSKLFNVLAILALLTCKCFSNSFDEILLFT